MNDKDNFHVLRDERTKLVNRIADLETENIRLREAVIAEREACAEIALKLIPDAADFDAIKTERTRELLLHGANIANAIKDRILRRNAKAV